MNTAINKEQRASSHQLGMLVALVSWAMLFAALFLSYTIYRFSNKVWPPMGMEKISLLIPTVSLLIIVLSSFTLELAKKYFLQSNTDQAKKYWWITFILGICFIFSQFKLWGELNHQGLYAHLGIFPSILHGFTWIHFAHMILGLIGLLYLKPIFKNNISVEDHILRFSNVLKFWHFLGIIWLLMYIILFLI